MTLNEKTADELKQAIYSLIRKGKRSSAYVWSIRVELEFRPATKGRPKDRLYIRSRGKEPNYSLVRYAVAEAVPYALAASHFLKTLGFYPIAVNRHYYKPDPYAPPPPPGRPVRNSEKIYKHVACLSWLPLQPGKGGQ